MPAQPEAQPVKLLRHGGIRGEHQPAAAPGASKLEHQQARQGATRTDGLQHMDGAPPVGPAAAAIIAQLEQDCRSGMQLQDIRRHRAAGYRQAGQDRSQSPSMKCRPGTTCSKEVQAYGHRRDPQGRPDMQHGAGRRRPGGARDGAQTRAKTSVPLVPPKPKLFFTATPIRRSRAMLAQ